MKAKTKLTEFIQIGISKSGKKYIAYGQDLTYTKKLLSFRDTDIAELLGVSVYELHELIDKTPQEHYPTIIPIER